MNAAVIEKKGRNNYYIRLRYTNNDGKQCEKWINTELPIKGNNKRKAEAMKRQMLHEAEKQKIDISNNMLFVDYLVEWLEIYK